MSNCETYTLVGPHLALTTLISAITTPLAVLLCPFLHMPEVGTLVTLEGCRCRPASRKNILIRQYLPLPPSPFLAA